MATYYLDIDNEWDAEIEGPSVEEATRTRWGSRVAGVEWAGAEDDFELYRIDWSDGDTSYAKVYKRGALTSHNERHTALAGQIGDEVAAFLQSRGYSAENYPSMGVEQVYIDNVTDAEWPEIQNLVRRQFDTSGNWRFNKKYQQGVTGPGEPPMEGAVIQITSAAKTAQLIEFEIGEEVETPDGSRGVVDDIKFNPGGENIYYLTFTGEPMAEAYPASQLKKVSAVKQASYFSNEIMPLLDDYVQQGGDMTQRAALAEWLRSTGQNDAADYVENLSDEDWRALGEYRYGQQDQPLEWVTEEPDIGEMYQHYRERGWTAGKVAQDLGPEPGVPYALRTLMPEHEIRGVGMAESAGPGHVTLTRAATGEQRQLESGQIMPLSVAMQRVADWTWTEDAKADMQALGVTGGNNMSTAQWDMPPYAAMPPVNPPAAETEGETAPETSEVVAYVENLGLAPVRQYDDDRNGTGSVYFAEDVDEATLGQIAQAIATQWPVYGDQVYVEARDHRIDFEPDISMSYEDLYY